MPKALHDLAKKLDGKPGIREPWAVATAALQKAGKLPRGKRRKRRRVYVS